MLAVYFFTANTDTDTDTGLDAITLIAAIVDNILSLNNLLKDHLIALWHHHREHTINKLPIPQTTRPEVWIAMIAC